MSAVTNSSCIVHLFRIFFFRPYSSCSAILIFVMHLGCFWDPMLSILVKNKFFMMHWWLGENSSNFYKTNLILLILWILWQTLLLSRHTHVCVAHILLLVISYFVNYSAMLILIKFFFKPTDNLKIKQTKLRETQFINNIEMKAIKIDTRNCSFVVFCFTHCTAS